MNISKILIIGFFFSICPFIHAQTLEKRANSDSLKPLTGIITSFDISRPKWITIGSQYDLCNSTVGLLISNGYDERPLIHFEEFSEKFIYKVNGQTNFNEDFSFGGILSWKYPVRQLVLISLEFSHYDYPSKDLYFQNTNLAAITFSKLLQSELILKFGHQTLNDYKNYGASFGIQKVLVYQKLYSGLSIGYFFDYFTYSAYVQGFVYKNIISIKLNYDRIDNFNFLNIGLNFTFER